MICTLSHNRTPWTSELSEIFLCGLTAALCSPLKSWEFHPRHHPWTSGLPYSKPTMVWLFRSRLKILDVAKVPVMSHPYDLRFISGFQLIILQTSENFSNILKTWSSFVLDWAVIEMFGLELNDNFFSSLLFFAYRNVDIISIWLQRRLLSFQLVDL